MELNENKYIITQIQDYMSRLEAENEHVKASFWPTDAEKPLFDLYHAWLGTPPTNPIPADKLMMFNAGKMMEMSMVETLNKMNLLLPPAEGTDQHRVEMVRYGVPITGYMDAVFTNGVPLEIKTFYGIYQLQEIKAGKPKEAYLKQLAVYMDFLGQNRGKLVYIERGTGEMFEFTLERKPGTLEFKCVGVEFNLEDTYKRWAKLYCENIQKKIEPKSEYRYKYPLEQLKGAPVGAISAARNNKAVFGDWQVKYSMYKDLIIEREGTSLGYSDKEIEKIKEITKGYTSKK